MNATIIIFIIAIVIAICIKAIYSHFNFRKKIYASIETTLSSDEKIIHKRPSGVHYLGGHPPFGSPSDDVVIVITNKRIIFVPWLFFIDQKISKIAYKDIIDNIFTISYEDIVDISIETKESITVGRVILTGLLAPLWKKKSPFILIGMKNDIGEISKVGLGFSERVLWPTDRWFRLISEQRYNWFNKNKKIQIDKNEIDNYIKTLNRRIDQPRN